MALDQWRYRDPAEVVDIKRRIEARAVEQSKEGKAEKALRGLKELFGETANEPESKDEH